MLPTFNYDDPASVGVIGSKAAELFMQEGAAISKNIEKRALTAEAQAKAPALAAAYADGLTRLAQGDMSGMETLAKARAESVGNPFLTAMTEDATKEGARMASMHIEKSLAEQRMAADAFRTSEAGRRVDQARTDIGYRQELDDYRAQTERVEATNNKLENDWQRDQNAENELAKAEGREPIKIARPVLRELPKKPVQNYSSANNANNTQALPVSDPLANESLPVVNPSAAATTQAKPQATFEPGVGVQEPPVDLPEDIQPSEASKPAERPYEFGPTPRKGIKSVDVGGLVVEYPEPKNKEGSSVTRNITTSTGSVSIKPDAKNEDPAKHLEDNLATVAADSSLSKWIAEQIQDDKQVVIRPEPGPNGKGTVWQPYAITPNGQEVPMGKVGPDGKPTGERQQVSEVSGKAWQEAQKSINGPMQGKVGFYMKMSDKMKGRLREKLVEEAAKGNATVDQVNKKSSFYRMKPITNEEVEKIKTPEVKNKEELKSEIDFLKEKGIEIVTSGRGASIRYKDMDSVTPELRKRAEDVMHSIVAKQYKPKEKKKQGYATTPSDSEAFPWLND